MRVAAFIVAALLFPATAPAVEAPLRPADFAFGMEVKAGNGDAFHGVTLPAEVYRRLTRADAGDLRVFNAAGESVPFMLRRVDADVSTTSATPPLFPIHAGGSTAPEGMSLRVRKDAQGKIITLSLDDRVGVAAQRLAAYVLDVSELQRPIEALELEWQEAPKDFLGQASVESSDDLAHWTTVVRGASLAGLTYGAQRLEHRRIEFPAVKAKFLRLVWPADVAMPAVKAVRAELAREVTEQRIWIRLDDAGSGAAGEYLFTAPGRLPADRARIQLPEANALVRAELAARDNARDLWRVRAAGVVYRLNLKGASFTGSDVALPYGSAERQWQLRVTPADGLGAARPTVEFGFVPQRLVFVARGAGPFTLAYGAVGVAPAQFPLDGVLAQLGGAVPAPAALGPETALGGSERLGETGGGYPWKTWLLWAALVAGVGLLAEMARRLFRQMGPGGGPEKPGN